MNLIIRKTNSQDFLNIIKLTQAVYPESPAWCEAQLESHLKVFPEGQFVAIDTDSNELVGYAASLIVSWDDYDMSTSWRDFTDSGMFTNHNTQEGRTLYGAEIMVHPRAQGKGVGSRLYRERENLVEQLGLLRIRAGARLRGYHKYVHQMDVETYVKKVILKEIFDLTLSFQIKQGFHVLDVTSNYLRHDPESLGYAAIIEWINKKVAQPRNYEAYQQSKFNIVNLLK